MPRTGVPGHAPAYIVPGHAPAYIAPGHAPAYMAAKRLHKASTPVRWRFSAPRT